VLATGDLAIEVATDADLPSLQAAIDIITVAQARYNAQPGYDNNE
jgi:hypothetical protein